MIEAAFFLPKESGWAPLPSGMVENPRHYRKGQKRLAHAQRTVSRRTKGNHRRRKAKREVACKHLKIGRQRRDFHFKTAKQYAERYSRICVEDLNVGGNGPEPFACQEHSRCELERVSRYP